METNGMKKYTQKIIEFYNKNSGVYIKNGSVVLKNKINKFIKLLPGKKILDVACGPGHDTNYLTTKGGLDCIGIDLSGKMIKYAKSHYQGKFRKMDFFNLKFEEKSFDGIWYSSALIHVDKNDVVKLFKNFKKFLKKNGVLGIITPKKQKRTQVKEDNRLFTLFEKKSLEKYLVIAGFEILESEIFSFGKMEWLFILSKKVFKR